MTSRTFTHVPANKNLIILTVFDKALVVGSLARACSITGRRSWGTRSRGSTQPVMKVSSRKSLVLGRKSLAWAPYPWLYVGRRGARSTRKVDACCFGHYCVQMRGLAQSCGPVRGWVVRAVELQECQVLSQARGLGRAGCTAVPKSSAPPHPAPEHARILRRRRRLANRVCLVQYRSAPWPAKALLRTWGRANPCEKQVAGEAFFQKKRRWVCRNLRHRQFHHEEAPLGTRILAVRHVQDAVIGESCNVTHRERAVGPKDEEDRNRQEGKVEILGDLADLRVRCLLQVEACLSQPCRQCPHRPNALRSRCAKEPRWVAERVAAQVTSVSVSCGMSQSSRKPGPIAAAKCSSEPRPKCNTCSGPQCS